MAKKVVSCRRGLEAFMANLLGMGEAFGEGVRIEEESSDLVDSIGEILGLAGGGVIFLKPFAVNPEIKHKMHVK